MHRFLPEHVGGVEIYTYSLAKELSRGHEVYVFCREDGFAEREFVERDEIYDGLKVRRVYYNLLGWRANHLHLFLTTFKNRLIERSFGEFLDDVRPEIVHIQHVVGMSAALIPIARRKGIPVIMTLHDYWFICSNSQLVRPTGGICLGPRLGIECAACVESVSKTRLPFIRLIKPFAAGLFLWRDVYLRRVIRDVDLFIAPSRFLRDKYLDYGLPGEKLIYVENGIDVGRITHYDRKSSSPKLRFAYIGNIAWHKGLHVLVEAFNRVPADAAELKIFGDLEAFPFYTQQIKAMVTNPSVRLMGKIGNERVGEVLSETDVLVVPSLWYENSPMVIQEAFAAKVPVLASNLGALPEKVRDGEDGLLFRPGAPEDLYAKICPLTENPTLIPNLKENIQPVKAVEENARELEIIYEQLIHQKNN